MKLGRPSKLTPKQRREAAKRRDDAEKKLARLHQEGEIGEKGFFANPARGRVKRGKAMTPALRLRIGQPGMVPSTSRRSVHSLAAWLLYGC